MPGVVEHLASKGGQPLGRGLGDISEADEAHPALRQLPQALTHAALLHLHLPSLPDSPVSFQLLTHQHQHQQNGLLRHGAGVAAPVVAHIDAPGPGGGKVDLIVSHAFGVYQLQARHLRHQRTGNGGNCIHKQNICVCRRSQNLGLAALLIHKHQFLLPDKRQVRHIALVPGLSPQDQDFHTGSFFPWYNPQNFVSIISCVREISRRRFHENTPFLRRIPCSSHSAAPYTSP